MLIKGNVIKNGMMKQVKISHLWKLLKTFFARIFLAASLMIAYVWKLTLFYAQKWDNQADPVDIHKKIN